MMVLMGDSMEASVMILMGDADNGGAYIFYYSKLLPSNDLSI